VDDVCLISANAQELQEMIHVCQTWSEKARMQINADKSKIMAFHETAQQKNARQKPMKKGGQIIYPAPFHLLSSFPDKRSEQQQCIDGTTLGSLASIKKIHSLHSSLLISQTTVVVFKSIVVIIFFQTTI